tara:strand:+ start:2611 stop:3723 length:1113 start_codon:yes stop_codon:yes gene_type:complete
MKNTLKIAITIDFNISPFSNGLQQNIIFLQKLLEGINDFESYLLFKGDPQKYKFLKKNCCKPINEILNKDSNDFDLIILMGINLNEKTIKKLKEINPELKIVLMQCGNQVAHDIDNSVYRNNLNSIMPPMKGLDAVWTLPQHDMNQQYVKNYFRCEKIIEVPYIWNNFFIENQITNQKINPENLIFKNDKSIIILEPNLTYQKSCLIPIFIAEEFERSYPGEINSCNVIGGKTMDNNDYLINLIISLDIYKKRKNFIKFQARMPFINAVLNYGSIVISHQIQNDLNYLYFDALYLNIPLIHNSRRLSNYGFYYENHNITEGAVLLKDCLENHKNNLNNQKLKSHDLFEKHSINNINNQKSYVEIIRSLIN